MRSIESALTNTTRDGGSGPGDKPIRWLVGVPFRLQTYGNLLYLALAFPLGMVYFLTVSLGVTVGVGLSFTLVGLPLLALTVLAITVFAALEAKLATHLVGIETPLPEAFRANNPHSLLRAEDGAFDALKATITAPTTWTGLVAVTAKFCYGVVAFTGLVTAITLSAVLLAAPFVYDHPDLTYTIGARTVETLSEALAFAGVGVVVAVLSLHLANGLATVGALLNAALLDIDSRISESASPERDA